MYRAVLWDYGGVLCDSPFDAFARYERKEGLPEGFLRKVNANNPDTNAWALLERGAIDLDEFVGRFEAEADAAGAGGRVDGHAVVALLEGQVRPAMVDAVRRCRRHLKTALVTNNVGAAERPVHDDTFLADLFDVVVQSSIAGVRKPDPAFYTRTLDELGVAAEEAVFLDDLGINLKPARALGMTTIKVLDPGQALAELEAVVGFPVQG
jgi:putative hydrolase of the HAD superfamily